MSKPPVRLTDDPQAPLALATQLKQVREADGGYDATRGLARLRQSLDAEHASQTHERHERPDHEPQSASSQPGHGRRWLMRARASKGLWVTAAGAAGFIAVGSFLSHEGPPRHDPPPEHARGQHSPAPVAELPHADDPGVRAPVPDTTVPLPPDPRREIEQLARIRALLSRSPEAALQLAEQSSKEFPHGALQQERDALSALALSRLGRHAQARELARAFIARYPRSPMRAALEPLITTDKP